MSSQLVWEPLWLQYQSTWHETKLQALQTAGRMPATAQPGLAWLSLARQCSHCPCFLDNPFRIAAWPSLAYPRHATPLPLAGDWRNMLHPGSGLACLLPLHQRLRGHLTAMARHVTRCRPSQYRARAARLPPAMPCTQSVEPGLSSIPSRTGPLTWQFFKYGSSSSLPARLPLAPEAARSGDVAPKSTNAPMLGSSVARASKPSCTCCGLPQLTVVPDSSRDPGQWTAALTTTELQQKHNSLNAVSQGAARMSRCSRHTKSCVCRAARRKSLHHPAAVRRPSAMPVARVSTATRDPWPQPVARCLEVDTSSAIGCCCCLK
ncbi:hypothetical protein HaLaN_25617 [Haematococcus lacustris]|uniref:Uncharacterized protein n=1 Tax=Haematococcus lacustris TaxID=44745 RepID=A0A6A0A447_HAELA|nr:hypothetical protein HaLaN_25617 [Haematococcus lacustris]